MIVLGTVLFGAMLKMGEPVMLMGWVWFSWRGSNSAPKSAAPEGFLLF